MCCCCHSWRCCRRTDLLLHLRSYESGTTAIAGMGCSSDHNLKLLCAPQLLGNILRACMSACVKALSNKLALLEATFARPLAEVCQRPTPPCTMLPCTFLTPTSALSVTSKLLSLIEEMLPPGTGLGRIATRFLTRENGQEAFRKTCFRYESSSGVDRDAVKSRKRAEYGFGEYDFKHRSQ